MKKLFIIGGIIVVLFAAIVFLTTQSNKQKTASSPYGPKDLHPSTIQQLDDPNYQNIILPHQLAKKIESGEPTTVYFFHPDCQYCRLLTPKLMPIAKKKGIEVHQMNLLEFSEEATRYGIDSWPVLIHFRDGQEVARMVGDQPEENIHQFFKEYEGK